MSTPVRKNASFLPVALAFAIPIIIVVFFALKTRSRPTVDDTTPINVMIHVQDKKGEALTGHPVRVSKDGIGGAPASNPTITTTDSAGIATVVVSGRGSYQFRVGHVIFREKVAPASDSAVVEFTFSVDQL